MIDAGNATGVLHAPPGHDLETGSSQLLDWLNNGRLRLVNSSQQAVRADQWPLLPLHVRQQALDDFQRVVRSKTKAAVLFLRD